MLIIIAIIHILPVSGVLGAEQLRSLYGIAFEEPNIEILMRHRSVLFGIFSGFLFYSAFRPAVHIYALIAATTSVVSFLFITWTVGSHNSQVGRVFIADVVALMCIVFAFVAYLALKFGRSVK